MIINFYEIDHNDFDNEALVGTVLIEDGKITSDDEDLLEMAQTFGGTVEEILENLSDWSNGYIRSEAVNVASKVKGPGPLAASGIIHLGPVLPSTEVQEFHLPGQHDQSSHGKGGGGSSKSASDKAGAVPRPMAQSTIIQRSTARGEFTPEVEKKIRAAGHDPKDYGTDGKPISGTDSWRDSHGISKDVYDSRPMKRYEGKNDPTIEEFYDDPKQLKFAKGKVASQSDGMIMKRTPVPGAEEEFGPIVAQIRPDNKIILDNRDIVRKQIQLQNAKDRSEKVNNWTPEDVIKERALKVSDAKANLKDLQTSTPDEIRGRANEEKSLADAKLKKAMKTGDEKKIAAAELEVNTVKYKHRAEMRKAADLEKDQTRAIGIAEQELVHRQKNLDRAKADPEKALKSVQEYSATQVVKKENQLDKVKVKYIFPPGTNTAARIEANPDPQNIKNLTQGKGRVYFTMEGNIKADAVLTQIKKEDPTAAVISVPSVTLWPKNGETDWVAQKYLKGREVILIPDADGVNNKAVMNQSIRLKGRLTSNGVDNVLVASPPLVPGKKGDAAIQVLRHPTGVKDARKGIDDHLGLGKGTLGDLTFDDSPKPNFDLSKVAKDNKIRSSAVPNMNRTMEAISDMAGTGGVGRISHKSLAQYTNIPESSIKGGKGTVRKLEEAGVIKIHDIFDPKLLGAGRREPAMDIDEIRRITRKAGVGMPDLDIKFVDDENNWETVAIIEILKPEYVKPTGHTKTLATKYKGLKTSADAPKPETVATVSSTKKTGTIARSKKAGVPGNPTNTVPGKRLVQSKEGAKRYGVPIGSPIPEAGATGIIRLGSELGSKLDFELGSEEQEKG